MFRYKKREAVLNIILGIIPFVISFFILCLVERFTNIRTNFIIFMILSIIIFFILLLGYGKLAKYFKSNKKNKHKFINFAITFIIGGVLSLITYNILGFINRNISYFNNIWANILRFVLFGISFFVGNLICNKFIKHFNYKRKKG